MLGLITAVALAGMPFDAAHHDVRDVHWDGDVVWVATDGGVEAYDADGTRLASLLDLPDREVFSVGSHGDTLIVGTRSGAFAWDDRWQPVGPRQPVVAVTESHVVYRSGDAWPQGGFGQRVVDAVEWHGTLVGFTADGRMLSPAGERLLPGPVADVAVVGDELRVACHIAAAVFDDTGMDLLGVPATAAGRLWGTVDGALVDDNGVRVGAVPQGITAVAAVDGEWWVGTHDGVWTVGSGTTRRTADGLCGNFITGLTTWGGDLVASTFDRGACVLREGGWEPIEGLPTALVNDVIGLGEDLWVATSDGLVRLGPDGTEVFGQVVPDAPSDAPGLNHPGVNGLASQDGSLWVADVLGPVRVRGDGRWRRYRWHVSGHSYQAIAACPTGEVWVASEDDGLAALGGHVGFGRRNGRSSWRHVNVLDGLPEDWVMAVACAGPGSAWVGTYRSGVGRIDEDGWHPVAGLQGTWVQALQVDGERLWVGTADGLFLVEGEQTVQVSPRDVHTLLLDGDRLWVGTRNGIDLIDLSAGDGLVAVSP